MKTLNTPQAIQIFRQNCEGSVGFVPTMGALHRGHMKLIEQAQQENDHIIVSIFVNPMQFNRAHDLAHYPRTLEADIELLSQAGVTALFCPQAEDMYPQSSHYRIQETHFSTVLEGEHRPGHFDGVLTVIMKLFQLIQPTKAYFGEKDYQQYVLIREMAQAFFMPVEVIACPTVRMPSGLAESSRNKRLSDAGLKHATQLYQTLQSAQTPAEARAQLTPYGFELDYFSIEQGRKWIAATLENVRLIDNIESD